MGGVARSRLFLRDRRAFEHPALALGRDARSRRQVSPGTRRFLRRYVHSRLPLDAHHEALQFRLPRFRLRLLSLGMAFLSSVRPHRDTFDFTDAVARQATRPRRPFPLQRLFPFPVLVYAPRQPTATMSAISESTATPNHALQRTAPRVTVAAILRPGVFTSSHLSP